MNDKIKLAVVTGGPSAELEVSKKSAKVVRENIDSKKYDTFLVDVSILPWTATDHSGKEFEVDLNTFGLVGTDIKFEVAFIAIHGTPAEDGKLQGYFDLLNIPYSASSVLASAITFDKDITKQLVRHLDIKLAKSILLTSEDVDYASITNKLELPLFVKPNKNGSSYGVSKVKAKEDLQAAVENAFKYDDEILIEEFIDGRELASGIFMDNGKLVCLPITEISTDNEFFDYEAKYEGKSKEVTPALIPDNIRDQCFKLSKLIYKELKLSGANRVDYFLKGDELYLLEVNTIPGLSAESLLPQQAIAQGYSLETFFDIIISDAMSS